MSEDWIVKKCEICGKNFNTLAEEPLKICGDCALEIGNPISLKEALRQLDVKLGEMHE